MSGFDLVFGSAGGEPVWVRQLCEVSERRAVARQERGIALHPIQVCLGDVEHGRHGGLVPGRRAKCPYRTDLALDVWCESVRHVRGDLRLAGLVVPEGFVLGGSESLVALPADCIALRQELWLRERRRCGCASSALTAATAATRSNQPDDQRDRDRDDHGQPAQQ